MSKDTILNPMALWGREMTTEEMHRLIEAAPYLLALLEEFIGADEAACGYGYGIGDSELTDRARAAIARVKGEKE